MSRNTSTITVLIDSIENGPVSYYGNPSFIVHTYGMRGSFRSMANTSFAYEVHNTKWAGKKAELTLTPAGRVIKIRELKFADEGGLKDQISDYRHCKQDII